MNDQADRQLQKKLADATRWQGDSTQLWKKALDACASAESNQGSRRFWMRSRIAASIALVGLAAIVIGIVLPSNFKARRAASDANSPSAHFDRMESPSGAHDSVTHQLESPSSAQPPLAHNRLEGEFQGDDAGRSVVRRATVHLRCDNVRVAFLKTSRLISAARSEFIESSSLTGEGASAKGTLTLRVSAEHLDEVLQALRELGRVHSEQVNGEDGTAQVVDVDARIRNEQRVETELLELLEKRADAPLKEILELRQQIQNVRLTIERLTAEQHRLARLVALASVLVIIEPKNDDQDADKAQLGAYFVKQTTDAWSAGMRFLADTASLIVRIAIGGAIWWVLLACGLVVALRRSRQPATAS